MPLTDIYLHQGVTNRDQRKAISDAIHATVETLAIPDDDRFTSPRISGRLIVPRRRRVQPPSLEAANVHHAVVQQPHGRTKKAVRVAGKTLQQIAGVPREDAAFRILETARENWWAAGHVIDPNTGYDARMTSIVE